MLHPLLYLMRSGEIQKTTATMTGIWTSPTSCAVKVPQVIPGKSNGLEIEGNFPLDQIVIDRE